MEEHWQGMQSKEGPLILFISLSPHPLLPPEGLAVGGQAAGPASWAGSFCIFAPARCWPRVPWRGRGRSAEQLALRRAVGGGEWGLAVANLI